VTWHLAATVFIVALGLVVARGTAVAPVPAELPAGEFVWTPQLAPRGPVLIVVGLEEQQAYVYRNGVRIGVASVSTGRAGFETPTGVFSILQKRREHYSNLYDNAPMPYMQRLTWDGIALHAGNVPGYPASHGCVRLPYAFSEKLFGITTHGMTVVISPTISSLPLNTSPGPFAPGEDPATFGETESVTAQDERWNWRPERSQSGPLNLLLSTQDKQLVVLRNGIEIGWAAIDLRGTPWHGTSVHALLEAGKRVPDPLLADRPALSWLAVPVSGGVEQTARTLRDAVVAGDLGIPQAFAERVYQLLTPGATLVITDEPIHGRGLVLPSTLMEASNAPGMIPLLPGN
jgi:hypothetical protein